MSPEPDDRLLPHAEALADGRALDWEALRRAQPDLAASLERLRQLEAIADAHRGSDDAPRSAGADVRGTTPIFQWGQIVVLEKLGEGGFAEVYRAWDPALDREVALKLSRGDSESRLGQIQDWLEEARRLARVRHPNVLVVHGVDVRDGRAGFWTDLVRGRTLERWLGDHGHLGMGEAALIGLDLCRALAAVHAAGLVHGDLKASNVMREGGLGHEAAGSGRIVLMDFGAAGESSPGGARSVPRVTPLSCAPEVLRGDPPTPASDLYSLGVLLYRLVTGRHPIESTDWADLEARVREGRRTPLRDLRPDLGAAFVAVVERALDPDPARRFPTAGHMEQALGASLSDESAATANRIGPGGAGHEASRSDGTTGRGTTRVWPWVAAGLVALAAVGVAGLWFRPGTRLAGSEPMRLTLQPPPRLRLDFDPSQLAISPDGRTLAFVAADSGGPPTLWVRDLRSLEVRELPDTRGADHPFWSPDSRQLAYFADAKLKRIGVWGGTSQTLCQARAPRGGSWSRDGVILFAPAPDGPLYRVPARGGAARVATTLDTSLHQVSHRWPCFLPDGDHFTYIAFPSIPNGQFPAFVGSLRSGRVTRLPPVSTAPLYAHPGHLIYSDAHALLAQPFDARHGRVSGEPVPIDDPPAPTYSTGAASATVSANGILAWMPMGMPGTRVTWVDRHGRELAQLKIPPRSWARVTISPDGRLAILEERLGDENSDLWLLDLERETLDRLTFEDGLNEDVVWSPDSREILYFSTREARARQIYRTRVDGSAPDSLFYRSAALGKNPEAWSPDGRWVLLDEIHSGTGWDLMRMPATGGPTSVFVATPFVERFARISPDGRWALYGSDESGTPGLYVTSFPSPGSRRVLTKDSILRGAWGSHGREVLYLSTDGRIMSLPVHGEAVLRFGAARELFRVPPDFRWLDPAPDGSRFLVLTPAQQAPPGISVVVNWNSGLPR